MCWGHAWYQTCYYCGFCNKIDRYTPRLFKKRKRRRRERTDSIQSKKSIPYWVSPQDEDDKVREISQINNCTKNHKQYRHFVLSGLILPHLSEFRKDIERPISNDKEMEYIRIKNEKRCNNKI